MIIDNFPDLVQFKDSTKCVACKNEASEMLVHLTFIGENNIAKLNFDTDCAHSESEKRNG